MAQVPISVGNTVPQVEIVQPPDGGFFSWGEVVDFEIQVFDEEDGTADCARMVLQAFIGHDEHSHPLEEYGACSGSFPDRGRGTAAMATICFIPSRRAIQTEARSR